MDLYERSNQITALLPLSSTETYINTPPAANFAYATNDAPRSLLYNYWWSFDTTFRTPLSLPLREAVCTLNTVGMPLS